MDDTDAELLAAVGAGDIILFAILITGAALLAYLVYRSMERPRLRLTQTADGERATVRDTVLYAVTIPFLVVAWYAFFFTILLFARNNLDAWALLAIPAAIIMSARLLAHINVRIAHETAKVVPLTLLTLIIISGGIREFDALGALAEDLDRIEVTAAAIVLVLVFDYLITAGWYWGWIRWRRSGLREKVAQDDGGIAVLADADGADGRA